MNEKNTSPKTEPHKEEEKVIGQWSQGCLDAIHKMVGCKIQIFESVTSNKFKIHVGQTSRFVDHHSPTELLDFLATCRQLKTSLLMQDLGVKTVTDASRQLLEHKVPPCCHAYLGVSSHEAQVTLVVVLDRPLAPENRSNVLTILNGHKLEQLGSIEGNDLISDEEVKVTTLPPADINTGAPDEVNPAVVEALQPDPDEICQALIEEIKTYGTNFWICQFLEDDAEYQINDTRLIHDKIKVLVSSGTLERNHLRAIAWFGLGAEQNRNLLDISFGTFMVIRSDQHAHLVAIAKIESTQL